MCQVLYNNLITPLLGISQYKYKHTHTLRYIKNAESSIVLKSVFTYSLRILLNVVLMIFFLLIPSRSSLLPQLHILSLKVLGKKIPFLFYVFVSGSHFIAFADLGFAMQTRMARNSYRSACLVAQRPFLSYFGEECCCPCSKSLPGA